MPRMWIADNVVKIEIAKEFVLTPSTSYCIILFPPLATSAIQNIGIAEAADINENAEKNIPYYMFRPYPYHSLSGISETQRSQRFNGSRSAS